MRKNKIAWKVMTRDELPDAIISTSLGPFKGDNEDSPLNQLNLYIMDTNFRVTKNMINILDSTEGVAGILPLHSYCIVLSLAKLFKSENIKKLIELRLTGRIINVLGVDDVPEKLIEKANSKYGNLIFPNGFVYKLDESNEEDKGLLEKCAELVGGVFS